MGLGAGSTVNTTSLGPPAFQMPYLSFAFNEAQRLYQQPGPQYYPGQMVADFTPEQRYGFQLLEALSHYMEDNLRPGLMEAVQRGLAAPNVGENPYLGQIADAITQRVNQAVTEQWLPNVRSGAISQGTLGGSRQALSEGLIGREASRELSNALASLYGDQYNRGMATMLNTMQLAPSIQQAVFAPGLMMTAIGEQQRALEQAKIDEAVQRWSYEQNLPYQKLAEFYNIISRPFGSAGESRVTAEGGGGGTLGGIVSILGWLLQFLQG